MHHEIKHDQSRSHDSTIATTRSAPWQLYRRRIDSGVSSSTLYRKFDLHIRGRDRDRAEERSPALEFLDELFGVGVCDIFHLEMELDRVE